MIQLYPYQEKIVQDVRESFRQGHRAPLIVAPTGSGKTVMFSYFAKRHVELGGRVCVLVHRQELIDQVSETLNNFGVPHGIISPKYHTKKAKVAVASVFTAAKRESSIEMALSGAPTLFIIDEAHHATGRTSWGRLLNQYCQTRRLGVTATPIRLSGEGLKECFDDLVQGPTTAELIESGHLSPYRIFAPPSVDLKGLPKRAGEYVTKEVEARIDKASITGNILEHYKKHANGAQTVVFCVSVAHAAHVSNEFQAGGIPSVSVDGNIPKDFRREIIRDFRGKRLRVLTSCELISEGFDCPAIECGIFLRPTQSLALWRQQAGRCFRIFPGKTEAILLDHVGNSITHGLPDDDMEWTLEGRKIKPREAGDSGSIKVCPKCFCAQRPGSNTCKHCGEAFPVRERKIQQIEGNLEEVGNEWRQARRAARMDQVNAQTMEQLVELGKQRGYKSPEGWAKFVYYSRKKRGKAA